MTTMNVLDGLGATVEDGVKWTAVQLSSVDLEFIVQRTFSAGEIARWFDMPLYKLGLAQMSARIKLLED